MQKKPNKKESLSGVPYHVTYLKMDDFDTARHKSRCIYYKKSGNHCNIKNESCIGSSHCSSYKEKPKDSMNEKPHYIQHKKCEIESIPCSIPLSEYIETKSHKLGILVKYADCRMTLLVDGKEIKYKYPDAFEQGHLIATPKIEEYITLDLKKAIRK